MLIPKDKIQRNFDRASLTYEAVSSVQKECARQLVEMIQNQVPNLDPRVILDLGTGTGFVAKALLPQYPESHYYVNDIASQMLLKARENLQHHPKVDYILGDMESLSYEVYKPCLSVSNFSFQWIDSIEKLIQKVFKQSRCLAFTYLLPDTFQEWGRMFERLSLPQPTFNYGKENKWEDFLKGLKPKRHICHTKKFILTFQNARDFMLYLRYLGANQSYQPLPLKALKHVLRVYDQPFSMTYQVLFVVIERT